MKPIDAAAAPATLRRSRSDLVCPARRSLRDRGATVHSTEPVRPRFDEDRPAASSAAAMRAITEPRGLGAGGMDGEDPARLSPGELAFIEALARETRTSLAQATSVYVAERAKLWREARIKDYVPVLAARRTRELLKAGRR